MPAASDGVELSPKSLHDLRQLSAAYKAGDKVLQKRIRTGLQQAAKPLAETVVRQGAAGLPRRGGLRARILASKGAVTASLAARNPSVSIRLANSQKDSLKGLDEGFVRHPVFRTGRWVAQPVRSKGAFTAAFQRNAAGVRDRVNAEVAKALDEIAREA